MASAGKTAINVSSEVHTTSTMTEDNCIVLYKPVFVNGETGKDPTSINMNTGAVTAASGVNTTDLGRRPDNPVKTLDAAILIGQAPDSVEGGSWGSQHNTYLNYYIVYATGSVHNELYKGNYTLPTSGYYTAGKIKVPNKVADDITYSMDTPAYMARYTGFDVITNSGETVKGESQYNYDHLLDLTNSGKVALQNIEIYGRRLTDGTDKAGEALVRISDGVTLKMLDNTVLANNFANGNRPAGEDLTPLPMTMKGGAVRIEAGGTLTMAGGRINNTQAVYGNAIYVDEAANKVGTVMLQNKPQIDGSIYLVGNKTVVNADKSYLPASGVNIALQHDYSGREVAVMTDGTKMDSEHQKLFGLTDSIRALYEVKPKEDEPHKLLLFLKSVYYIDPNISDAVANRDGMTADTAFKTLDELYDVLRGQQDLNGVMVYVVNPITVEKGKTVKLINASKTSGVVRKYYSLYTNILGETKKTETQVYFKRYVQPKLSEGGTVPTGFTAASNKSMIFDVQGTLTLKGIYLDGHSRELEDGQQFVYVRRGGIIECDNVTDHATAEDAAEENAATEETAQSQESNDPDDYTEEELAAIELPATPENAAYPKYSDNLHHYYGSVGISEQKEQGGDRLHFVMDQSKPEDARLVPANLYMNELVNRGTAELQAYATTTPLTGKQLAAFVWRLNKQVAAIGTEGVPAAYADKYAAAAKTYDDVGGEWALDYKYTVIGQIVRGLNVAEGISQVKVTAADRKPKKDIVIDHVEILEK